MVCKYLILIIYFYMNNHYNIYLYNTKVQNHITYYVRVYCLDLLKVM